MSTTNHDALIAFLITALAGAATALGASVVFFPSLVKLTSRRVLAGALGFSAGVMTYVSFVEIFQKSVGAFEDAEFAENMAYIYATASFFGGVVVMKLVDVCVQLLSGGHHHHHRDRTVGSIKHEQCETCGQHIVSPHNVGQSDDPVAELNEWHQRAEREIEEGNNQRTVESKENINDNLSRDGSNEGGELKKDESVDEFDDDGQTQHRQLNQSAGTEHQISERIIESGCCPNLIEQRIVENPPLHIKDSNEDRKLITMGISTALAIAIHNFPEGLATFVATLHDPSVGAVLAIAIGIHNIPEGLCVALPIYYATGNRWKAFGWACLSGASEPIAALLGWAILAQTMSQIVYAILFGLVAGMMVIISMKELLPTAHRYDAEDTVVTYSFVGGMALISLSLVLFLL